MTSESGPNPLESARETGKLFAQQVWNPQHPLTYSAVSVAGRSAAEAAGITDSALVDTYAARFSEGYYEIVRPREAAQKHAQAQAEGLPKYLAYALYLRGFAVTGFIMSGIIVAIGAFLLILTASSNGTVNGVGIWLTLLGLVGIVVSWQVSRYSQAALVIMAIAIFLALGTLVIASFSSSATVIILPIGFAIVTYRRFIQAGEVAGYLQDYARQYGRLSITEARAKLAANPAYAFIRTMIEAQQRTRRQQTWRQSAIVAAIVVVTSGGIFALVHFTSTPPPQTAIPFAESNAANLNVTIELIADEHTQPGMTQITITQFSVSTAGEDRLTHGETWTCDGVVLTQDDQGNFTGNVPLLPAKSNYTCFYQHGSDSTTLITPGSAIPHILTPKDGATFAPDPLSGAYEVRWTPDKNDQMDISASLDGSSSLPPSSGEQPDDGLYGFTITSFYSNAPSDYSGPGTLIFIRTYSSPSLQGFGGMQMSASSTIHIVWASATSDAPTATPQF